MGKEKLILAYSGGLDTSVAIAWLKKDYDVIAVCMDVGEGKDLDFIHDKALTIGAIESYILDVKDEFAEHFVLQLYRHMRCMNKNTRLFQRLVVQLLPKN